MCGICGIIGCDDCGQVAERVIRTMCSVMAHRGPDDEGVYRNGTVGMGHRRLSIIDVSGGHQPMANEDDSIWIVYNGEIYNHAELRKDLEKRGHRYRTLSDTETILHLYEEYGEDCVEYLQGMFAFAIHDQKKRRTFLARDRLGIKPLYYWVGGGRLVFGSEIKSVLASGLMKAELNPQVLPEMLAFGYISRPETLFKGIHKLMPAHTLSFDDGDIQKREYWYLDEQSPEKSVSDAEWCERFGALFEDSVRARLMSDVPLGMFLSGGLDSSAIAAMMALHATENIRTFSVGFAERGYSELPYAKLLAGAIGAEHSEITLKPEDCFSILPKLIWHEDEPIRFPASVPLYYVSKLAGESVKVVLTGEGADELMAGYARYWAAEWTQRWSRRLDRLGGAGIRRWTRRKLWGLPLSLKWRKRISHSPLYIESDPRRAIYNNFHTIFTDDLRGEILKDQPDDAELAYESHMKYFNDSGADDTLGRMLYTDIKTYLVELLMKQDQMSMATSIESRVPFLDHRLVELCSSMPSRVKLRGRTGKWVLRQAMRDKLPKPILTRRKMGFPVPLKTWFAEEFNRMAGEILLDGKARRRGFFNPDCIERILLEHKEQRRDFSGHIWLLMNIELWAGEFVDGNVTGPRYSQ